ncbi:MerR family transcriptional regulator [Streptomyces sp. H72]
MPRQAGLDLGEDRRRGGAVRKGLLEAERGADGYREYEENAVLRVKQIRHLLGAGLSSEDIEYVLPCALGETPELLGCPGLLVAMRSRLFMTGPVKMPWPGPMICRVRQLCRCRRRLVPAEGPVGPVPGDRPVSASRCAEAPAIRTLVHPERALRTVGIPGRTPSRRCRAQGPLPRRADHDASLLLTDRSR